MKKLFQKFLILFIFALILPCNAILAQTPTPAPTTQVDNTLDLNNSIIPGCSLSAFTVTGGQSVTEASRKTFISNCFQGIFRFIIVLAALATILRLAISGVALLDPSGSRGSLGSNSRQSIQNLVIGLLLMTIGWNLLPILNASFNNLDFLKLPGVEDTCKISNACETPEKKKTREAKEAVAKFDKALTENKFIGNFDDAKNILETTANFCAIRNDAKYKDLMKDISTKACDKANVDKFKKATENGGNNPDKFVDKFYADIEKLRAFKRKPKEGESEITYEAEVAVNCQTYNYENSTSDKGKAVYKICKESLLEPDSKICKGDSKCLANQNEDYAKRRNAYFATIK
jgi:hypothetical protein